MGVSGVGSSSASDLTQRAHDAIGRRAWQEALELLTPALDQPWPADTDLELLAQAAYGAGDLETTINAWERLHTDRIATGDRLGAAGAATQVAMYLMMDTGLMTPVRAWVARAARLLEDHDEQPVHAWLAMTRVYERLLSGDLDQARWWAERTIELGDRHHAPAPATLARIARARLRIFDGEVDEGLALLDDAAVTIMSGAIEPLVVGMAYCELICAMQGLAQYDRAEQWTDAMEAWRHGTAVGGINGRCRVHRAEILRLRGSCADAEQEALQACDELRPWMRREFGWPLTELGTIRLRRGDLEGAEQAFLEAQGHGWDPQPGLALLLLERGEVGRAFASIGDALDRPVNAPSKERPPHSGLRRAPLLEALTEIALAAGELTPARAAADELHMIAERFRSEALLASAELSRARVALAAGDTDRAIAAAGAAVQLWCAIGAPYEGGVAREVLAQALRAAGDERGAGAELRGAQEMFARIGARRRLVATSAALAGDDPTGVPAPDPSTDAGPTTAPDVHWFRLDGDTRTIRFAGNTVLLHDLKGMHYLERLLATPGREFHVLDLVIHEAGTEPRVRTDPGEGLTAGSEHDAGAMLDAEARDAYRRRLQEIDEDIEEARQFDDLERIARAEADRDYLVRELSRAVGLSGRVRQAGSTSERARSSVTRTLRYALQRIADHHPELGRHLEHTVRTGTYCCYEPDPRLPVAWRC